jgi:hypothetical protein
MPKVSTAQLSAEVGSVQVTTAEQLPGSAVCVMLSGVLLIVGFWMSATVTVMEVVSVFPP